ncbi:MAG: efflux RND transporter periplasmic adaptor subunit [Litoreibacter sp.]
MQFFRRSLVGLFLCSVTFALLVFAGSNIYASLQERWAQEGNTRPARERVFAVNVIAIEPTEITPVLTSFGEIRSRRTLDVRAPIAGRVVELAEGFEDGGAVRKGQLLARIDPAEAQTAVDVAKTDVIEAQSDLRDAQAAILLASDELAAAQEQSDLRARALLRQQDLRQRNVGTEAAVEVAELEASSARQAILSRRQALQQGQARVDQAETLIERRQITLTNAERLLADTEIYAAFDGRLTDVQVSAGGIVSTNERLAQLVDPDALEVSFRISTTQFTRLIDVDGQLINAPVSVTLDVLGTDLEFEGRLSRESAAVTEGTTGRVIFATLPNPRGLRPGDFVTVHVDEPKLTRVVKVPAASVGSDQTVLLLGEDDRLVSAEVTLLRRQGDDVIVRAQELGGREIVSERSQLLGAGIKVKPLRAGAAEEPQAPEMLTLDADRKARLIAYVETNKRLPNDVRERMLVNLNKEQVPAQMVARLESRMGS